MKRDEFIKLSDEQQHTYIRDRLHLDLLPEILKHPVSQNCLIGIITDIYPKNGMFSILPIDCGTTSKANYFFDEKEANRGMRYPIHQLPESRRGQYVRATYKLNLYRMQEELRNLPMELEEGSVDILDAEVVNTVRTALRTEELKEQLESLKDKKRKLQLEIKEKQTLIQEAELLHQLELPLLPARTTKRPLKNS